MNYKKVKNNAQSGQLGHIGDYHAAADQAGNLHDGYQDYADKVKKKLNAQIYGLDHPSPLGELGANAKEQRAFGADEFGKFILRHQFNSNVYQLPELSSNFYQFPELSWTQPLHRQNWADIIRMHDLSTNGNEWLDLKGKSTPRLQWDSNYWNNKLYGTNKYNDKWLKLQQKEDNYLENYHNYMKSGHPQKAHEQRVLAEKVGNAEDNINLTVKNGNVIKKPRLNKSWLFKQKQLQLEKRHLQKLGYTDNQQITIQPNMNYIGLARQYHLPLKQIEAANPYPAKALPIGGKLTIPLTSGVISTNKIKITKGMNYWDLAQKYHTSVAMLRKVNKYPDKGLPVGGYITIPNRSPYSNNKLMKIDRQLRNVQNHINQDAKYLKAYNQEIQRRQAKIRQKEINASIDLKVNANMDNGFTSIFRADHKDDTVVRVSEISPTEEVGMNAPTKSIDNNMPQGDFSNVSQMQLSGSYQIFLDDDIPEDMQYTEHRSRSYRNMVNQYKTLMHWAKQNVVVGIVGFNLWSKNLITDIQRSANQASSGNALNISITFQYYRPAYIKNARNTKAPASKKPGRHNRGKHAKSGNSIVIKPHMTYSGLARRFHKTTGQIERANNLSKEPVTDLHPGKKLVIPK